MSLHNYWRSLKKLPTTELGPVKGETLGDGQLNSNQKVLFQTQDQVESDPQNKNTGKSVQRNAGMSNTGGQDLDDSGILPDDDFVKTDGDIQTKLMVMNSTKRKNDWAGATMDDPEMIRALNEGAIDPWNHPTYHKFRDRVKDKELTKEVFFNKTFQSSKMRATQSEKNFR